MDFEKGRKILETMQVIEVYGTQDEFITEDSLHQMNERNTKLNLEPRIIRFEGRHELNTDVLLALV